MHFCFLPRMNQSHSANLQNKIRFETSLFLCLHQNIDSPKESKTAAVNIENAMIFKFYLSKHKLIVFQ